ncbi:hypothetical protein EJ110_NYTH18403 [Nymphaea thermarum]|nr:hypothetical protein EJ110_NYTH18403 [Nymphaea thermarum]
MNINSIQTKTFSKDLRRLTGEQSVGAWEVASVEEASEQPREGVTVVGGGFVGVLSLGSEHEETRQASVRRRRSVEAWETSWGVFPGGGLPEMEMEQEVEPALIGVAPMEEEPLLIRDSSRIRGKSSLPSPLLVKDMDDFVLPLLPSSRNGESEAVGDPAPFGGVGRRGPPQPPSWADHVAGRGSAREEDLPPLKVILGKGRPRIVVTEEDLLMAARWSPGQPLEINPSTTAHLSVTPPGLPPYFWNGRIFKAVAMGLQGDFLKADTPMVQMSRTNFARILLDLPIKSELPPEVEIDLGGGHILMQTTDYEGRLRFCRMCGVNSHPPKKCPKILNSKVKDDYRTSEAGHMVTEISLNRRNGPSSGSQLEHLTAANKFEMLAET